MSSGSTLYHHQCDPKKPLPDAVLRALNGCAYDHERFCYEDRSSTDAMSHPPGKFDLWCVHECGCTLKDQQRYSFRIVWGKQGQGRSTHNKLGHPCQRSGNPKDWCPVWSEWQANPVAQLKTKASAKAAYTRNMIQYMADIAYNTVSDMPQEIRSNIISYNRGEAEAPLASESSASSTPATVSTAAASLKEASTSKPTTRAAKVASKSQNVSGAASSSKNSSSSSSATSSSRGSTPDSRRIYALNQFLTPLLLALNKQTSSEYEYEISDGSGDDKSVGTSFTGITFIPGLATSAVSSLPLRLHEVTTEQSTLLSSDQSVMIHDLGDECAPLDPKSCSVWFDMEYMKHNYRCRSDGGLASRAPDVYTYRYIDDTAGPKLQRIVIKSQQFKAASSRANLPPSSTTSLAASSPDVYSSGRFVADRCIVDTSDAMQKYFLYQVQALLASGLISLHSTDKYKSSWLSQHQKGVHCGLLHEHQRNIAGGSIKSPQAFIKTGFAFTGGHDEIGNSAAVNVMLKGSGGACIWMAWNAVELKAKLEGWWRAATDQDKEYIAQRFGPFALHQDDPATFWRFWRHVANHEAMTGASSSRSYTSGSYVWDSIAFMMRIGVQLYYAVQLANQVVASPSHAEISMHAVFYYAEAGDVTAYQFAINDCMNLQALSSQVKFYGVDYIGSREGNTGFTTGIQLPIYRFQYIMKNCGERYTDCLLGQELDQRLEERMRTVAEWRVSGTADNQFQLIKHERGQNRYVCIECDQLIDLILINNCYCDQCFFTKKQQQQQQPHSSQEQNQLATDLAHATKYSLPLVEYYMTSMQTTNASARADASPSRKGRSTKEVSGDLTMTEPSPDVPASNLFSPPLPIDTNAAAYGTASTGALAIELDPSSDPVTPTKKKHGQKRKKGKQ